MPRTPRRKRILWTSEELKLLKQLAGKESVRKISKLLKRSEAAIRFKAWQKRITLAARKPVKAAARTATKTAARTKTPARPAAKKSAPRKAAKKK